MAEVLEKILGKFDTPEARDTALAEIHKKVLGEEVPLPAFKDDEAKNKAYTAYEKAMRNPPVNGNGNPPPPPKPEEIKKADEPIKIGGVGDEDLDWRGVVTKAGLDPKEIEKQWLDHGELTTAQYAALKPLGYNRKLADGMARGEVADAVLKLQVKQEYLNKGVEAAGGAEPLKNLEAWFEAKHPERVKDLNEMLAKTPKAYPEVVRMMKMEHAEALGAGKAQPLVVGGSGGSPAALTTWAQVRELNLKAMDGDKAAAEQLRRLTPEDKKKLK